jgi:SAM-dependent methyltransferase
MIVTDPYYRADLALVHHLGFGSHADDCAPGILDLLRPVRRREGTVLELGCGSGPLTRHLLAAGHRVVACDASPAMLDLARRHLPDGQDIRLIVLPDDPLPAVDAVVSVGHVLSYLPDEEAIHRALVSAAVALRPGGVLAVDLCDLAYGQARRGAPPAVRRMGGWLIVTEFSQPSAGKFVRDITTFLRNPDGTWRRDDERHENVLIDTSTIPAVLAEHGVEAVVGASFGPEELPVGLVTVIGHRAD